MNRVYLDWNATAPPLQASLTAMAAAAAAHWGNPASVHATGRGARDVVERCREAIAELLDADARDVVLTSGGTEANNIALSSAPALVVSRLAHPSVTQVAEALERQGVWVRWQAVAPDGRWRVDELERTLGESPVPPVVAVTAVNHETGVIQPVPQIARAVQAAGGRLHVDAVQAVGKIPPEAYRCGATVALSAHKLRGPKGIGALRISGPPLRPVLLGGSQERGMRPGTQSAELAAGFEVVGRRAASGPSRYEGLTLLRDRLERACLELGALRTTEAPRAPHVSNLSFPDWAGDELVAALDLAGVSVSSGSACSAGTPDPSPVVTAMLGAERARHVVRLSLGDATTEADVDFAIAALRRLISPSSIT